MGAPEPKSGGTFRSIGRIVDSGLTILQNRVELAALELQEEKVRFLQHILRAAAVVVCGVLALVSATAMLVVIFWEYSPVLTLGLVTTLYTLAMVMLGWSLQKRLKSEPGPFSDTVAEFKKDRECLPDKT